MIKMNLLYNNHLILVLFLRKNQNKTKKIPNSYLSHHDPRHPTHNRVRRRRIDLRLRSRRHDRLRQAVVGHYGDVPRPRAGQAARLVFSGLPPRLREEGEEGERSRQQGVQPRLVVLVLATAGRRGRGLGRQEPRDAPAGPLRRRGGSAAGNSVRVRDPRQPRGGVDERVLEGPGLSPPRGRSHLSSNRELGAPILVSVSSSQQSSICIDAGKKTKV